MWSDLSGRVCCSLEAEASREQPGALSGAGEGGHTAPCWRFR